MAVASEKRMQNVENGIIELRQWMKDLIRMGIGKIGIQGGDAFKNITAQMIDAQAPGLAAALRKMASIDFTKKDWDEKLLTKIAQLHRLLSCFDNRNLLPEPLLADVRHAIGWYSNKETVLQSTPTHDRWLSIWRTLEKTDEGILTEKIWFYGLASKKFGVLFTFFVGNQRPMISIPAQITIEGNFCFYPSALPNRILIKDEIVRKDYFETPTGNISNFNEYQEYVIQRLQSIPFIAHHPFMVNKVSIHFNQKSRIFELMDCLQNTLPLTNDPETLARLHADSCGKLITVFGLGENNGISIKAYWIENFYSVIDHKE